MRKHAGIRVHKRTTVTGMMTKHKYFMYLMLSKSSGSQQWPCTENYQINPHPGHFYLILPTRETLKCLLCQPKLACPARPFILMTNVHFRTRESQEELKVFTAIRQAALQSSCHLHHKWRASILYSGCKYLWSACSKFLNCHITWACPGRAAAPERGKTQQLAPSSVRPEKRTGEGAIGTQKTERTGWQRIVDRPLQDGGAQRPACC